MRSLVLPIFQTSLLVLVFSFFSCKTQKNENIPNYQKIKAYIQDSLNEKFSRSQQWYVLVGNSGCSGCKKQLFDFFKNVNYCRNLTLVTNSPYLSDKAEEKVKNNIDHYFYDKNPLRLQKLSLKTSFTPSIIHLKSGEIDSLINLPPNRNQLSTILERLPCSH